MAHTGALPSVARQRHLQYGRIMRRRFRRHKNLEHASWKRLNETFSEARTGRAYKSRKKRELDFRVRQANKALKLLPPGLNDLTRQVAEQVIQAFPTATKAKRHRSRTQAAVQRMQKRLGFVDVETPPAVLLGVMLARQTLSEAFRTLKSGTHPA